MRLDTVRQLALIGAVALAAATCDNAKIQPGPSNGSTKILLTDAPFPYDKVARVDIFVVSVQTSIGDDTSATSPESFSTIASPNRTINLLALQGGLTDELAAHDIPPGGVKAVRLTIDTDKSSITMKDGRVLTGSSTPGIAWQSSAGRPVLNATIEDKIVVPVGGTSIVIDFDVGNAFIDPAEVSPPSSFQGFIFSPVIRAADAQHTGHITGEVRATTAGGAPVVNASLRLKVGNPTAPENNWGTIATARTDANGVFRFSYIPTSAKFQAVQPTWTYMVVVDPPSGSGLTRQIRSNVNVTATQTTSVGTIILP